MNQSRHLVRRLLTAAGVAGLMAGWTVAGPAPAAGAQPPAPGWTAYVTGPTGTTPFDTTANAAGAEIPSTGSLERDIAITPDAATAYLTNVGDTAVTTIDTAHQRGRHDRARPGQQRGARRDRPQRRHRLRLQLPHRRPGRHGPGRPDQCRRASPPRRRSRSPAPGEPGAIAVTPDGATVYVQDTFLGEVFPIDTAARTAGNPIPVGTGGPGAIAITPNGATAYVSTTAAVVLINTAGNTVAGSIPITGDLGDIAITPDGATAFVATNSGTVVPINTATRAAGQPINITGGGHGDIAITPDGATAYLSTTLGVVPIDVATRAPGAPIPGTGNGGLSSNIAITPDQAPVAALSFTPPHSPVTFDASASTVRYGTIASYAWNFGDGTTAVTSTPTTTHEYAGSGTFTARVTLTSSGGTSTTQVFTGQTMYRNGGPQAVARATVTVPAEPQARPSPLARTGNPDATLIAIGATTLALGAALTLLARRRHTRPSGQST